MSDRLQGVNQALIDKVNIIQRVMLLLGFPMLVTDGFRTVEEQQALFAQGRGTPGKIVTKADGIKKRSKHQSGRAVDMCFLINGRASWAESNPWNLYGEVGKALGLKWGGDWATPDRPHMELPE